MSCFSMSVLRFVIYSTRVHWRLMASHEECLRPGHTCNGVVQWDGPPWSHNTQIWSKSPAADLLSDFIILGLFPHLHTERTTLLSTLKFNQEVSQQEVDWALIAAENKDSISLLTCVLQRETIIYRKAAADLLRQEQRGSARLILRPDLTVSLQLQGISVSFLRIHLLTRIINNWPKVLLQSLLAWCLAFVSYLHTLARPILLPWDRRALSLALFCLRGHRAEKATSPRSDCMRSTCPD